MELTSVMTEIYNNKRAIFDGVQGIIDYNENEISLKSGRMTLSVLGKNLKIKMMAERTVVIEGFINSVNFSYI